MQCEMDQEVKIKEEPAWLEGTTNASLENIEHVSEMIPLKKEAKSELTEPGPMQENSFEPFIALPPPWWGMGPLHSRDVYLGTARRSPSPGTGCWAAPLPPTHLGT
ncbi:uncharacterized protein [Anabrus simplex]|uniref:uncharacterized protein isoform X1 n=1 Tax=Anabrus simplex TaxID=316456 RepID=UPI0035A33433